MKLPVVMEVMLHDVPCCNGGCYMMLPFEMEVCYMMLHVVMEVMLHYVTCCNGGMLHDVTC